jgi:hypothetical protein
MSVDSSSWSEKATHLETIEKLGHTITNILVYNIKHHLTKFPFPMFFVDLKPATNNKGIFNVEYFRHCKVKFEPTKQKKKYCSMC